MKSRWMYAGLLGAVVLGLFLRNPRQDILKLREEDDFLTLEEEDITVPDWQKQILDQRRETTKPEDFIPWNDAKKKLKIKSK